MMLSKGGVAKDMTSWIAISFLIGLLGRMCEASHFRGAHFWWRPWPGGNSSEVEINVRISWRRDYKESTFCDDDVIESGKLIGPVDAGYIMCTENCDDNIGDMDFQCTDFSTAEDWVSGLRAHHYTFPGNGVYKIKWRGRSWLETVLKDANDVDWSFLTTFDLRPRPDTENINMSPKAAVGTLFRVQEGCEHTLYLPVTDEDGDRVECRWAAGKDECGGICGEVPGFTLDGSACSLHFGSNNSAGLYALAIQIEDFLWSDEEYGPMSSVPLQFIVQVYPKPEGADVETDSSDNTSYCDRRPQFIAATPEADSCYVMEINTEQSAVIVVRTKDAFTSIIEINTVSTVGMHKSVLDRYGDDPRDFYVTITWTPLESDNGERIFCFYAVDSSGMSSGQRCIYLIIGESHAPTPVPERAYYIWDTSTLYIEYSVTIVLSTEHKEIRIFDSEDTLIVQLSTSSHASASSWNNTLQIQVPVKLEGQYYILMDQEPNCPIPVPESTQYSRDDLSIYVEYSDRITVSSDSKEISIFGSGDTLQVRLETTNNISVSSSNRTLQLRVPEQLNGEFYVLMEQGAVVAHCGRESDAVTDKTTLSFSSVATPSNQTSTESLISTSRVATVHTQTVSYSYSDTTDNSEVTTGTGITVTDNDDSTTLQYEDDASTTYPTEGEGRRRPDSRGSTDNDDSEDNVWLIVVIVVAVLLFILLLIIIAVVVRHKRNKEKTENYDREGRQEEYLRNLQYQTKIVGYDGPYAPNFHDIEVKFR